MGTMEWLKKRRIRNFIVSFVLVAAICAGCYYAYNVYLPNALKQMTNGLQHWGEK